MAPDANARPHPRARRAAWRWPITLGAAALALACGGCQQVWQLGPPTAPQDGAAGAAADADAADPAALETVHELQLAREHLERRLVAIEAQLASGSAKAPAEDLRDERLLVTVALMLTQQDLAAARRGDRGPSSTVEQQLDRAARRIAAARRRLARGEVAPDRSLGWADRWEVERRLEAQMARERDGREFYARPKARGRHGCLPGDPLCSGLDELGPPEETKPSNDQPTDTLEPPRYQPLPIPGAPPKPDPKPAEGREAARVAHAQAPTGVTRVVGRHQGQLVGCLPQPVRARGLRVRVRLRLDAQGAFREPRVLGSELDPPVAACIEDVFRQMRIAGYDQGSRHLTVPLWLGGGQ